MAITAQQLCQLAGELAAEHGMLARHYAERAYRFMEYEGDAERAAFWFALAVLVEDVIVRGVDPENGPTIQ